MADEANIRETIERYWARLSAGDREGFLDLFSDDAWIEDPVGTPRHLGRAAIGEFWDQTREMAPDIELRGGLANICGHEAAFVMEVRPKVGDQVFLLDVIDVMTFDDDGRIATMKAYFDPASIRPAAD